MSERIAVIGLGYVGLPLALALAKAFSGTIGYDISAERITALQKGHDWSNEQDKATLLSVSFTLTDQAAKLEEASFFIVTVPTPITNDKKPDLKPLLTACRTIGDVIKKRKSVQTPVIVFESTVYPGLTEKICGPEIEKHSGLKRGTDFMLGYSPERINPGDAQHSLENVVKIIAGENEETLQRMEHVYGGVIKAGLHKAPSIAVAEAAKVLENTQRDLNVALMNELALICDRLNIRTRDVLEAAGTKWNFLRFTPGLVGGHCIGVDPYYLTTRAEELGYRPKVILAGRRINDRMGEFIAEKICAWLKHNKTQKKARIGILGLTFKENVRDIRNSRVPDIIKALKKKGVDALIHDPMAEASMAQHEYKLSLCAAEDLKELDVLVLAVPHAVFLKNPRHYLDALKDGGFLMDIKSALKADQIPARLQYWSL